MPNCCFANLTVRFFTKIQDQIKKSPDYYYFSLQKDKIVKDYISFISIETTHNIDGVPEKQ